MIGIGAEVAHKGRWGLNVGLPHLVAGTYRLGDDDQEWAPHVGFGLSGPQVGISYRAQRKKQKGKEKRSGLGSFIGQHKDALTHGAEIAGLGVLGIPSAQKLRKIHSKTTSPEEKKTAKYELAGLGILGVPSALHLAHGAFKKMHP